MKKENREEIKKRCRWLAEQVRGYSSYGIASKVYELINNGTIKPGEYLPTTRDLAEQLGVVPSVVSTAWSVLRDRKMIEGTTRSRIRVLGPANPGPDRSLPQELDMIDLSWLQIDPALTPDLSEALLQGYRQKEVNRYLRIAITPMLEKQVRARWPYSAESFLAINGSYDGLMSIFTTLLLPGETVAVVMPTAALLLDMLGHLKIGIVPVSCDNEGLISSSLKAALADSRVAAFFYQPRANSVNGVSTSPGRMEEIATAVRDSRARLIEYDTMNMLSSRPYLSLGQYYPDRTLHITAYSVCYGPDLRLAVISGPDELIQRIYNFRNFIGTWSSRILQGTLAWLMQDARTQKQLEFARAVYLQRRQSFIDALAERGIMTDYLGAEESLSVWIKVPSEEKVVAFLLARDIIVMPGSDCGVTEGQYIRVSTSTIQPEQIAEIADAIAEACKTCQ